VKYAELINPGSSRKEHQRSVFKGQNSKEVWGGVPVVLLFRDDYQLFPVMDEGATRNLQDNWHVAPNNQLQE
jgi:hypothetical protein